MFNGCSNKLMAASITFSGRVDVRHSSSTALVHRRLKQGLQGTPLRSTVWPAPYGPVLAGSVGPNSASTGVLKAYASCMGLEPFVLGSGARRNSASHAF